MRLLAYSILISMTMIISLYIASTMLTRLQITLEEGFWLHYTQDSNIVERRSYLNEK